ncbi:hypothetical protein GUJ93_ZPchr0002g23970 [Zizania palustris]|uniref:Uncharacterized protein n=1 Tax=Zizania palustris TaxID=103762 RepID=A0A8J5S4N2_ZIZPA|nr:hypothetical protein GUJ93_ZPchr0002g23970 [Zizania palustris]
MAPALVTLHRRLPVCSARRLTFRRYHHCQSPAVPQAPGLGAPRPRYSSRPASTCDHVLYPSASLHHGRYQRSHAVPQASVLRLPVPATPVAPRRRAAVAYSQT